MTTDDRGRVIQLHLVEQRLNGSLPAEIGDLTMLKWLNIARNPNLTGDIPPEMAQLTELEVLYLWENDPHRAGAHVDGETSPTCGS